MTAITHNLSETPAHIRPFDVGKDLEAVADLVETCFSDSLDEDGRRYIQQMHAAARNPRYLRWATAVADHVSMPLTGYVWEDNGFLAGNLNLIPFLNRGRRCYLIANVAVDPSFRRRGIARLLTSRALEHARKKGASAVWLHVREENNIAFHLYSSLGFRERARRTTWELYGRRLGPSALEPPDYSPEIQVVNRQNWHWPQQHNWLDHLYPPEVTWHLPFNLSAFRPGLFGMVYRLVTATQMLHWSALIDGALAGVLTWQPRAGSADYLWLAADERHEEAAIAALLSQARRHFASRRRLILDYPAGHAVQAFQYAGFHLQQTLIWMAVSRI